MEITKEKETKQQEKKEKRMMLSVITTAIIIAFTGGNLIQYILITAINLFVIATPEETDKIIEKIENTILAKTNK